MIVWLTNRNPSFQNEEMDQSNHESYCMKSLGKIDLLKKNIVEAE